MWPCDLFWPIRSKKYLAVIWEVCFKRNMICIISFMLVGTLAITLDAKNKDHTLDANNEDQGGRSLIEKKPRVWWSWRHQTSPGLPTCTFLFFFVLGVFLFVLFYLHISLMVIFPVTFKPKSMKIRVFYLRGKLNFQKMLASKGTISLLVQNHSAFKK